MPKSVARHASKCKIATEYLRIRLSKICASGCIPGLWMKNASRQRKRQPADDPQIIRDGDPCH